MSDRKHEPLSDEPKKPRAKKDTKHWCRGKKYREHVYAWKMAPYDWVVQFCINCNKVAQRCPPPSFRSRRPCVCGKHRR